MDWIRIYYVQYLDMIRLLDLIRSTPVYAWCCLGVLLKNTAEIEIIIETGSCAYLTYTQISLSQYTAGI